MKEKTGIERLEELFKIYSYNHDPNVLQRMQSIPADEVIDAYVSEMEALGFSLAHGANMAYERYGSPFYDFLKQNFGKYVDMMNKSYDDLHGYIKTCSKSFADAFKDQYPVVQNDKSVYDNILEHTKDIISFFVAYHGFNASSKAQGGVASRLGYKLRFTDFEHVASGYLWMFKENPDYYLDDFLEIYNTRVMNYVEKGIMFRTVPYDDLTPLADLDFHIEIDTKESEAILELTDSIYTNVVLVDRIRHNSDSHFIKMMEDRLNIKQSSPEPRRDAITIVMEMLEDKITKTIMDYRGGFPHIPEIMMQADRVCEDLFNNLQKEVDNTETLITITPLWCAYAGIGATAMWNDNWPKLRDKGIVPALTEERGYFAMDEFVMDYIGIGWDSEESKTVQDALHVFAIKGAGESIIDGDLSLQAYRENLKAMYYYGIVFEMSRLGMH